MSFYKNNFKDASVTPKMHMLQKHLIPQLTMWKFGMGFLGEQGAESIHASFNSIERAYSGIPNKKDRLLRVMHEHHLRIEPENQALQPPINKRKGVIANTEYFI
jgi:hypothetical protein